MNEFSFVLFSIRCFFYCSNFRLQFLLIYFHAVCAMCMCVYRFGSLYFIYFFLIGFPRRWFGTFNLFPFVKYHTSTVWICSIEMWIVVRIRVPYFNIDEAGIAIVDCMNNEQSISCQFDHVIWRHWETNFIEFNVQRVI